MSRRVSPARSNATVFSLSLGLLALALALAACGSDAERVREADTDPTAAAEGDTSLSAEIAATELQEGDCITSTLPDGISVESVVIVPCSDAWQYRVTNSFQVADSTEYPGNEFFAQQAAERCDQPVAYFLLPSPESWELNDRTVICLEEAPTPTDAPGTAAATRTSATDEEDETTAQRDAATSEAPAEAPMAAADMYSLVSPSIAFVRTPTGTGSGILIEGGYVVTNYHVVWPYETVQVAFPGGTEFHSVVVVGWDSMADLAVLGPVDVSAPPLQLADGEGMAPGSELFLVGYPAEVDESPEPTITRGILSRFREWEPLGMTYLQTDAAIAGGQSGGALVNSEGAVVGISTFSFSEAGFGLATSAADDAPIVERLIRGMETSGLGERAFPAGRGALEFNLELVNLWDNRAFILDAEEGTTIEFVIDGPADGLFRVSGPLGSLLEVDDRMTGIESGAAELPVAGIYFLQVEMFTGTASTFHLVSSVSLKPFHDPDDGRTIAPGDTVVGNIDFYFDLDWYSIRLEEGEVVAIFTDSINVDTFLSVDFPNSGGDQIAYDDDSGGGLFGTNSALLYRAPATGEYFVAVADATGRNTGGYYLSVEQAPPGSDAEAASPAPPDPQIVDSPFGQMRVFQDPLGRFQIQTPQLWVEQEPGPPQTKSSGPPTPKGGAR